jgi:hypothetical protein
MSEEDQLLASITKMFIKKNTNGSVFFFEVRKHLLEDIPDLEFGSIESHSNGLGSFYCTTSDDFLGDLPNR